MSHEIPNVVASLEKLRNEIIEMEARLTVKREHLAALQCVHDNGLIVTTPSIKIRFQQRPTTVAPTTPEVERTVVPPEVTSLKQHIIEVLPAIPNEFSTRDVRRALMRKNPTKLNGVNRSSLAKGLGRLAQSGQLIRLVLPGRGKSPAIYRKLGDAA